MKMDIIRKFKRDKKKKYSENVRPQISALYHKYMREGKKISREEWYNPEIIPQTMNSYERELFTELFDNEMLIKRAKECLDNSSIKFTRWVPFFESPPVSYDEVLQRVYIHELIKRLEDII